jgi:hypothetical protein
MCELMALLLDVGLAAPPEPSNIELAGVLAYEPALDATDV